MILLESRQSLMFLLTSGECRNTHSAAAQRQRHGTRWGGGDGMLLSHMSQTNSFAVKVQQCGLVLSVALLPKYNPNISADIDLLHEFRALPAKANCLMSSI